MKAAIFPVCCALLAAGLAGCEGTQHESSSRAPSSLSPEAQEASGRLLSAYEKVRAALARDAVAPIERSARDMESSARDLVTSGPASLRPHASALVTLARHLGAQRDVEKARAAFGEVSRQVVPMLVIEPALRERLYIFECSMAQNYGKWVQRTDKIDNPYMGKSMLTCGESSDWKG